MTLSVISPTARYATPSFIVPASTGNYAYFPKARHQGWKAIALIFLTYRNIAPKVWFAMVTNGRLIDVAGLDWSYSVSYLCNLRIFPPITMKSEMPFSWQSQRVFLPSALDHKRTELLSELF